MWQGKFFSPVWVLLCVFKSELVANPLAQTSQICSLILSWTCLTWFFISLFLEKIFPQWMHSNAVFGTNTFTACSLSETGSLPSIWPDGATNGQKSYLDLQKGINLGPIGLGLGKTNSWKKGFDFGNMFITNIKHKAQQKDTAYSKDSAIHKI